MRKKVLHIIFLSLLITFSSCKKNQPEFNSVKKLKPEFNQDIEFNNWLKKHKLEKKMFIDSLRQYDYTLWQHSGELHQFESLYFKEYSTDSSYMLILNFDNTLPIDSMPDSYSFSFLDTKKSRVFYGLGIINNNSKIIDYHWLNDNSFMILQSNIETKHQKYFLTKLKIEVDSIWYYITK